MTAKELKKKLHLIDSKIGILNKKASKLDNQVYKLQDEREKLIKKELPEPKFIRGQMLMYNNSQLFRVCSETLIMESLTRSYMLWKIDRNGEVIGTNSIWVFENELSDETKYRKVKFVIDICH